MDEDDVMMMTDEEEVVDEDEDVDVDASEDDDEDRTEKLYRRRTLFHPRSRHYPLDRTCGVAVTPPHQKHSDTTPQPQQQHTSTFANTQPQEHQRHYSWQHSKHMDVDTHTLLCETLLPCGEDT